VSRSGTIEARSNTLLALLLAACAGPRLAPADTPEGRRHSAQKLFEINMPPKQYREMMDIFAREISAGERRRKPDLPAEYERAMLVTMREMITYDQFGAMMIEILSERFTATELDEMVAFYRSPTGTKASRLLPEVTREAMTRGDKVIQERLASPEVRQRLRELMGNAK
jgi:hypothetical protein